jgi:hypothetical protein
MQMKGAKNNGQQAKGVKRKREGRGGPWAALLAVGGALSLAVACALALAGESGAEAAWIARRVGDLGLASGDFLVLSALGLSLAAVCAAFQGARAASARIEKLLGELAGVAQGVAVLEVRASRLQLGLSTAHEALDALLRANRQSSEKGPAELHDEATYRLAASMDQLGRRIEDQLSDQTHALSEDLCGLSGSVLAAREQLDALLASPLEQEPAHAGTDHLSPASTSDADERKLDSSAQLPDPLPYEHFEVEVEFEDPNQDGEAGANEPAIDPAQFDWGAPPDPPAESALEKDSPESLDSGLGLLDELDDEGAPIEDSALDPLRRLLTEELLQEALANARRRLLD